MELLLVTSRWPNNQLTEFLDDEIIHLSRKFNRIVVAPMRPDSSTQLGLPRSVVVDLSLAQHLLRVPGLPFLSSRNITGFLRAASYSGLGLGVNWRESGFTRFFRNYYLLDKFGYHKRLPHLSSLIVSGRISLENAFKQLQEPLFDGSELRRDKDYVCRKLRLSESDFDAVMNLPNRPASDYRNSDKRYVIMKSLQKNLSVLRLEALRNTHIESHLTSISRSFSEIRNLGEPHKRIKSDHPPLPSLLVGSGVESRHV